jgi:hypothetical protein
MGYTKLITQRHIGSGKQGLEATQSKYTNLVKNEIQGNLRPDLLIVKNNKATIITSTVPFEKRMESIKWSQTTTAAEVPRP